MNTQPKLTIVRNTVDQGSAIDVLRILHQHLRECETLVLNLPLRETYVLSFLDRARHNAEYTQYERNNLLYRH